MPDKPNSARLPPLAALAAALFAALLAACASDTPEQRLRATIAAMQDAVERGETSAFIEHVSADFSGDHGQFDRQSLRGFLAAQQVRRKAIGVTLGPLDVTLRGDRALVRVDALVTGGDGLIPDSGQRLDIESGWRDVDGEWECYSAELK
jgi:hypothetical protein